MTFVFPVLLGSLALVGIPVLIHLIMRKKPRIQPFPAFRFLLQRQRINVRRLRLRHLVLLALRILLLACIALALARPQLFLQNFSLRGDRPLAVVMIFDTSFTMQYKTGNDMSRLEQAKKHGLELIDQLPQGSRVAILDTADQPGTVPAAMVPGHEPGPRQDRRTALETGQQSGQPASGERLSFAGGTGQKQGGRAGPPSASPDPYLFRPHQVLLGHLWRYRRCRRLSGRQGDRHAKVPALAASGRPGAAHPVRFASGQVGRGQPHRSARRAARSVAARPGKGLSATGPAWQPHADEGRAAAGHAGRSGRRQRTYPRHRQRSPPLLGK